jgi:hypothetical protein
MSNMQNMQKTATTNLILTFLTKKNKLQSVSCRLVRKTCRIGKSNYSYVHVEISEYCHSPKIDRTQWNKRREKMLRNAWLGLGKMETCQKYDVDRRRLKFEFWIDPKLNKKVLSNTCSLSRSLCKLLLRIYAGEHRDFASCLYSK